MIYLLIPNIPQLSSEVYYKKRKELKLRDILGLHLQI